jgi:hypothetical protein
MHTAAKHAYGGEAGESTFRVIIMMNGRRRVVRRARCETVWSEVPIALQVHQLCRKDQSGSHCSDVVAGQPEDNMFQMAEGSRPRGIYGCTPPGTASVNFKKAILAILYPCTASFKTPSFALQFFSHRKGNHSHRKSCFPPRLYRPNPQVLAYQAGIVCRPPH